MNDHQITVGRIAQLTNDGLPPIVVSSKIVKALQRWAKDKKVSDPTEQMIIYKSDKAELKK